MISNNMLTCSATLYKRFGVDEDRNPTYSEPVELTKIYVVSTQAVSYGQKGAEPNDVMTLYYDCFNSLPRGLTFIKGDKIVFNDTEYFINSISPFYSNGLDHFEIGLK